MTNAEPGRMATIAPPVLTPAILAARWGVSARTVLNLIARGELRGTQIGKQWRVAEADAAEYEHTHQAPARFSDTGVAS